MRYCPSGDRLGGPSFEGGSQAASAGRPAAMANSSLETPAAADSMSKPDDVFRW